MYVVFRFLQIVSCVWTCWDLCGAFGCIREHLAGGIRKYFRSELSGRFFDFWDFLSSHGFFMLG